MSRSEEDPISRKPWPTIELHNVPGFKTKDGDTILTKDLMEDLEELRDIHPMRFQSILSSSYSDMISDEFVLRNIIMRTLPITILGDETNPPILNVYVERFIRASEISLLGRPTKEQVLYAVRFVPQTGRVAEVSCQIDRRISSWGLQMLTVNPEKAMFKMHNLYSAEFWYEPQPISALPPLISPDDL